jgi:hypothetical protein
MGRAGRALIECQFTDEIVARALDARGDTNGITVSIVVRDPKLVTELQRRAAHDLEAAAQLRTKQVK